MKQYQSHPLSFWKALLYLIIASIVLSLITPSAQAQNPHPLKRGTYSVKRLQKLGYTVPPTNKKRIYIMPTADSSKVNILKRI